MPERQKPPDNFRAARLAMVQSQLAGRTIRDPQVLEAMRTVARHLFVPAQLRASSYDDNPLPIGQGQTISQPYMVAIMTESLRLKGGEKVLEVGTGSGYQAAILAELGCTVHTIEQDETLAKEAKHNLTRAGYDQVVVHSGDGTLGLADEAPFEAIIVTAGGPVVPAPLTAQLSSDGGVLVIPVGDRSVQELLRVTRRGDKFHTEDMGGCRFVPLVGHHGW